MFPSGWGNWDGLRRRREPRRLGPCVGAMIREELPWRGRVWDIVPRTPSFSMRWHPCFPKAHSHFQSHWWMVVLWVSFFKSFQHWLVLADPSPAKKKKKKKTTISRYSQTKLAGLGTERQLFHSRRKASCICKGWPCPGGCWPELCELSLPMHICWW